jgi:hypothetical protein|tara:strand:- start:322 stop:480 length:159 start_codon:yes stop_codon:yes gene_type:complete
MKILIITAMFTTLIAEAKGGNAHMGWQGWVNSTWDVVAVNKEEINEKLIEIQ